MKVITVVAPLLVSLGLSYAILARYPLSFLVLILSSCKEQTESSQDGGLGRVGERIISEQQFRYFWDRTQPRRDTPETRDEVMENFVSRYQRLQRAYTLGLERDPSVIDAYESLLIARLDEVELRPKLDAISVTEKELRKRYETVKNERYQTGKRVRVAVLWMDTRGQAPLELRFSNKLKKAREILLNDPDSFPQDFGSLSLDHSEHRSSRYKGGDIGWLDGQNPQSDPWRAAVINIANKLDSPGNLSEVVSGSQGTFLVRLIEQLPSSIRSFDDVRVTLERDIVLDKRAEIHSKFQLQLKNAAPASIDQNALNSLSGLGLRNDSSDQGNASVSHHRFQKP